MSDDTAYLKIIDSLEEILRRYAFIIVRKHLSLRAVINHWEFIVGINQSGLEIVMYGCQPIATLFSIKLADPNAFTKFSDFIEKTVHDGQNHENSQEP